MNWPRVILLTKESKLLFKTLTGPSYQLLANCTKWPNSRSLLCSYYSNSFFCVNTLYTCYCCTDTVLYLLKQQTRCRKTNRVSYNMQKRKKLFKFLYRCFYLIIEEQFLAAAASSSPSYKYIFFFCIAT